MRNEEDEEDFQPPSPPTQAAPGAAPTINASVSGVRACMLPAAFNRLGRLAMASGGCLVCVFSGFSELSTEL
jgi:hypothetical protein